MADGMILSVEQAEITLPSNSAVSYNLTKGQNTDNCVPFATAYYLNGDQSDQNLYPDIYFESGPKVTARRTGSQGSVYLTVNVVEFNPDKIAVQQGTFDFDTSNYSSSAPKRAAYNSNRTAAVAYYRMISTSDRWNASEVIVFSVDDTTINFYHNALKQMTGHWYVFEALNDEFTVQQINTGDITPGFPYDLTISQVDTDRTVLFLNYRTGSNNNQPMYCVSGRLYNSTTVRYESDSHVASIDFRGFVVEFAENSGVVVSRGSVYYPGGTENHNITWDITPIDTTRTIIRSPHELSRNYSNDGTFADRDMSYSQFRFLNNGTQINTKNAGSSNASWWARSYYELIEFPGPKIGVDFQGVSLSNVIIK